MDPHEHIEIHVNARTHAPVKPNFIDGLILRMGGPERVIKACDRAALATCVGALVYVVLWAAVAVAAFGNTLPGLTPVQVMILSLAWTPLMAAQVGFGFWRYRAIALLMEEARHLSKLTIGGFHQRVADAIAQAVAGFEERRANTEKPTLQ